MRIQLDDWLSGTSRRQACSEIAVCDEMAGLRKVISRSLKLRKFGDLEDRRERLSFSV